MKYVVSMDHRMQIIHRDVTNLKRGGWSGRGHPPSMRAQMPCESVEQLQLLEDEITESSVAYNDLVSIQRNRMYSVNFLSIERRYSVFR